LVAYLQSEQISGDSRNVVMEYLKKLPPPAVDLEFRSLCTYEEDEEGIELLRQLLQWLTAHITTGEDFEILQAYLHRMLSIYMHMIMKLPALIPDLRALQEAHVVANSRFRHLVQKNLCLLKMMGNLPIA
jgi:hypothetical protein